MLLCKKFVALASQLPSQRKTAGETSRCLHRCICNAIDSSRLVKNFCGPMILALVIDQRQMASLRGLSEESKKTRLLLWCKCGLSDDWVEQRRIQSHGSRVVFLELWGPEGRAECKVKFDVADVAYLVVSALETSSATCSKATNVWRSFERVESSF